LGYDNQAKIKSFLSEVELARVCTIRLAEKMEKGKSKQQSLYNIAESETRRVEILDAMLDNDMDKVCKLLKDAIEKAFDKRKDGNAIE
jgi:hypothetical protein